MAVQDVELSRSGIKISYLRFLSDSAAGQIVILIALAAYYFPVLGGPLRHFHSGDVSTEVKVLVAVLLLLLSSPLGLAINATSWFVLSWLQVGLQRFWFNETGILRRPPFNYIREEFQVEYIVMRAAGRSSPAEEAMEREVIAILSGDCKIGNERLAE